MRKILINRSIIIRCALLLLGMSTFFVFNNLYWILLTILYHWEYFFSIIFVRFCLNVMLYILCSKYQGPTVKQNKIVFTTTNNTMA